MSERRPSMQSRAVAASYKSTGTHASQHLFRKVWLELRQRLAVYCDARLRLLDEPQHRRTRGLDDRCDLCRLTATPNHELGGSVDAPRCAGEHPRKAAGQIWGQKRDLNPSAAARAKVLIFSLRDQARNFLPKPYHHTPSGVSQQPLGVRTWSLDM